MELAMSVFPFFVTGNRESRFAKVSPRKLLENAGGNFGFALSAF
jgi:hypothetical protein